jgi:hypothetical protein
MIRLTWTDLPPDIRAAIEHALGSQVVAAASQESGFSPGLASRVELKDGRRAFVKAVAAAANPDSIGLLRREARVLPALPPGLPLAHLLAAIDTGDWVARHLGRLTELGDRAVEYCDGGALAHGDLRADNMLIRDGDGAVILIDGPDASVGSPWFDAVLLLVDVLFRCPGYDVDALLAAHPVFAGMPDGAAQCLVAGALGYFTYSAAQPEPPGLAGVRRFQRDEGAAALGWLRSHLGD